MFLTACIETLLMRLFGYRKFLVLVYFFVINLISNFLVNITYQNVYLSISTWLYVLLLELMVVLFEIGLLGIMTGYTGKMVKCVFFTNLISFFVGFLLFWLPYM